MKENERLVCPRCGNETIARKYRANDDFLAPVYRLKCALCDADLGEISAPESPDAGHDRAAARLSALLGGETTQKVTLERGDGYRRGCRNCRNFVSHPFKAICSLTGNETDPMHDCGKFVSREEKK
ncbi:MAG: hypothetical protein MJ016_00750 [Victivallaceae bacterium]|nr:hypothetical protein [Victivallaceae bacterium]